MEKRAKAFIKAISTVLSFFNPTFQVLFWYSLKNLDKIEPKIDDSVKTTKKHLDKAIDWLLYQQTLQPDSGIACWVGFKFGFTHIDKSYPEVTGYIVTTLCDYYEMFKDEKILKAAIKAADFELPLQNEDGSFPGSVVGRLTGPSVFNSAQIINGLVRIFEVTGDQKYLDSARRATDWIASIQDEDGSWTKLNYMGMKRVYDSKVDQSLLDVDRVSKTNKYKKVVEKNYAFIATQQQANGWFANCDNSKDKNEIPLTHTIGYTIEGLVSCYLMDQNKQALEIAQKTADVLLEKFEKNPKMFSGRFNKDWQDSSKSSCMTGNAQISMCWIKLYRITGEKRYLAAALKMIEFLKNAQIESNIKTIDGAIPSSYPFWGEYNAFTLNSWGVKYFADALILEYQEKTKKG
ncbi:MAG: beta-L-arabinofuranosidase domain-containing protein [Candidatus Berkelbacteria bacterium]